MIRQQIGKYVGRGYSNKLQQATTLSQSDLEEPLVSDSPKAKLRACLGKGKECRTCSRMVRTSSPDDV
jgi:hypothetical protein